MFDKTKQWPCQMADAGTLERSLQQAEKKEDVVIHDGRWKFCLTHRQHLRRHRAQLMRYKEMFANHPLRRGANSCQAEVQRLKFELRNAQQSNATLSRKLHDKTGEAFRLPQVQKELANAQKLIEQMKGAEEERKQRQIHAMREADAKVFEADAAQQRAGFVRVMDQETPLSQKKAEKVAEMIFQAKRWDGKSPIFIDCRRVYTALVYLKRVTVEALRIEEKNGAYYVGLPVPDRVARRLDGEDQAKGNVTIIMPGQAGGFESQSDTSAQEKAEQEINRMNGEIGQAIIELRQSRKHRSETTYVRFLTSPEVS